MKSGNINTRNTEKDITVDLNDILVITNEFLSNEVIRSIKPVLSILHSEL